MRALSVKLLLALSVTLATFTLTYCAEEDKPLSDDEVDINASTSSAPEIDKEKNTDDSTDAVKDVGNDANSVGNDEKKDEKVGVEESDKTPQPESDSGVGSDVTANSDSVTDSAVTEIPEQTIKNEEVVTEVITGPSEVVTELITGATEVVTGAGVTEVLTEVVTGFVTEIQTELQTAIVTEVIKDVVIDLDQGFDVKAANLLMDTYISGMKKDSFTDKLYLLDFKPHISSRWGSIQLHSGKVSGLSNAYRVGDILLKTTEFGNIKSFSGDVIIPNVIAKFKADMRLFHRINIRNRVLTITIDKLLAHLNLDLDVEKKKLIVKSVEIKYLEGFKGMSGRLIWPLNKLSDSILRSQQDNIIKAIKLEVSKHMQKVVTDVNVENAITQLLTKH